MEMNYIPKPEILGDKFEGFIVCRVPLTRERMKYLIDCNVKFKSGGEIDAGEEFKDGEVESDEIASNKIRANVELISKFIPIAAGHCVSVAIKNKESGKQYSTFEDLESDPECDKIVTTFATDIVRGFSISKN